MKKYIIGIIVVALIVVTTAFSFADKRSEKNSPTTTYWFLMDGSGNVTTTQPGDLNSVCPLTGDGCAREYNASQTEIVNGVRQVKPDQVNHQIDSRAKP